MDNGLQKNVNSAATIIQQISNSNLSKEDKSMLEKMVFEAEIELRKKMGDSYIAEHDFNILLDKLSEIDKLSVPDKNKKFIDVKQNLKTGSGNIEIKVTTFNYNLVSYLLIGAVLLLIFIFS